jgi:antimicrobial peptide system SdpA family protein
MGPSSEREDLAPARRAFWVTAALVAVALLCSLVAAYPANVLVSKADSSVLKVVAGIIPQGWAFFTKDPQSAEIVAYRPGADGLTSLQATPQTRVENWWGLTRTQRAQGPEIAALSNKAKWRSCVDGEPTAQCVDRAAQYVKVTNGAPHPTLCGKVVLVQEKPVEWSFRTFVKDTHTAVRTANVAVECKEARS